jgi:hypothetical protein
VEAGEFKVSLGYIMRSCLKTQTKPKSSKQTNKKPWVREVRCLGQVIFISKTKASDPQAHAIL